MATLQVRGGNFSDVKQKAIEDARRLQDSVQDEYGKSGKEPPEYQMLELIGKGSFGRVYKASSLKTKQLVAVKIIDIEQSDTFGSMESDTYSDLLKEINALKLLGDGGAKNINLVIEALPVGQTMWIITEYCAGGSVATLMKPTSPGGLQEKWIIPILREVAEAIFWVHRQGIIHRDIKCGNILVTETGGVQLCDFGVSGIIETKFDKRSTVIGTPHWMAPELVMNMNSATAAGTPYGTEVDIWAFGAMVYEIASGYPPNVRAGMDLARLLTFLRQQAPRLEGDQFSSGLKDMVAYCLEPDPTRRPTIEQIQEHSYIYETSDTYPASSLAMLVRAYKLWESQGGARKSLFAPGGAMGLADNNSNFPPSFDDDWNFSTTAAFDQQVFKNIDAQAVYDVYGSHVDFNSELLAEQTSRPVKGKARRRPPPQLPVVTAPLEKVFDPNTMSNYQDNSRLYYGKMAPPPTSDLPLRDDSNVSTQVRESLIDLDASLDGSHLSMFVDMETIKAGPRVSMAYDADGYELNKPPLSDPAELNPNRRTQDWKFPVMAPPASANPATFRFPMSEAPIEEDSTTSPARPQLLHHPTEPVTSRMYNDLSVPTDNSANRVSTGSLIDLDMGLADTTPEIPRPSTSQSDVASMSGSEYGTGPFELERQFERQPSIYVAREPSIYVAREPSIYVAREPSMYITEESDYANGVSDVSFGSDSRPDSRTSQSSTSYDMNAQTYSNSEYLDVGYLTPQQRSIQPQQRATPTEVGAEQGTLSFQPLPPAPPPPSLQVLQGEASASEVKEELRRIAMSLGEHLSHANAYLSNLPVRKSAGRVDSVSEAA